MKKIVLLVALLGGVSLASEAASAKENAKSYFLPDGYTIHYTMCGQNTYV